MSLEQMYSLYLIVFTVLGGLVALFSVAGWSSYTEKKLPDAGTLFRWFTAGVVSAGLGSYTWIYGFNGNPEKLITQVGDVLEVESTIKTLSTAVGGNAETVADVVSDAVEGMTVGMPNF
jgi:hypothetical protein